MRQPCTAGALSVANLPLQSIRKPHLRAEAAWRASAAHQQQSRRPQSLPAAQPGTAPPLHQIEVAHPTCCYWFPQVVAPSCARHSMPARAARMPRQHASPTPPHSRLCRLDSAAVLPASVSQSAASSVSEARYGPAGSVIDGTFIEHSKYSRRLMAVTAGGRAGSPMSATLHPQHFTRRMDRTFSQAVQVACGACGSKSTARRELQDRSCSACPATKRRVPAAVHNSRQLGQVGERREALLKQSGRLLQAILPWNGVRRSQRIPAEPMEARRAALMPQDPAPPPQPHPPAACQKAGAANT